MSLYAVDEARGVLVAAWPASSGFLAGEVASLGPTLPVELRGRLSECLTRLSEAVWDTYVRPASSAADEQERWRREQEHDELDQVTVAIRQPNLPDEAGFMEVLYSPVGESAHRLGRTLHQAADPALTEAIVTEVRVELDAVARAELGDLSGRAVQAVARNRLDASPVQVAAADVLLADDPFGSELLGAAVDPAAASVAAAHWLAAAAVVAAEVADNLPDGVFAEADDINAVSVEVPTLVVERIVQGGQSPRDVVLDLLRAAVAAGEGVIADLPRVLAERDQLRDLVERLPADQQEETFAAVPARTTLLDPQRPARDLLEHLLDGIASCHLLYTEYTIAGVDEDEDDAVDDLGDGDLDLDGLDGRHLGIGPDDLPGDVDLPGATETGFAGQAVNVADARAAAAAERTADEGRRRDQMTKEFLMLVRGQAFSTKANLI